MVGGIEALLRIVVKNNIEKMGATDLTPAVKSRLRVFDDSYMVLADENIRGLMKPCAIIIRAALFHPHEFKIEMPPTANPICETDE